MRIRIGYSHVDRLISYPHRHNLSACSSPIRVVRPAHESACCLRLLFPHAARVDEGTDAVGGEAEHAVAHPVDEGAVVEEQVHRH